MIDRPTRIRMAMVWLGQITQAALMRRTSAWRRAFEDPALVADLVEMAGLYAPPVDEDGALLSPTELAFRAGERALALALLAKAEITHDDIDAALKEVTINELSAMDS